MRFPSLFLLYDFLLLLKFLIGTKLPELLPTPTVLIIKPTFDAFFAISIASPSWSSPSEIKSNTLNFSGSSWKAEIALFSAALIDVP